MKLINGFRMFHNQYFVQSIQKRINISKEIFIMDIELGIECLIPEDIGQNCLPLSFRYYDSLISIVKDKMSKECHDYFSMKNEIEFNIMKKTDLKV
jgi:hypothetical protein